jgi:hypothetical protein
MRVNAMDRQYLKGNGWTEVFDGSFVIVYDGWQYELVVDEDGLYTLTNKDLQDVYDCSYNLREMMIDFYA